MSQTHPAMRSVRRLVQGMPTSDGAGVKLRRVIGQPQLPDLDPFLMLDEFGTDKAEDYIAGFPDHPHRGFETVTYMLDGRMRHRDNHGNEGVLVPGSVQWMTAGRGLVHSEMPEQQEGRMRGFQLWLNLPARDKMTRAEVPGVRPGAHSRGAPRRQASASRSLPASVAGIAGPILPAGDRSDLPRLGTRTGRAVRAGAAAGLRGIPVRVRGLGARSASEERKPVRTHELAVLSEGAEIRLSAARCAGGGTRARYPGRGAAAARTGGQVRTVRDEHPRGAAAGVRGLPERAILRCAWVPPPRRRHRPAARSSGRHA